MAKKKVRCEFNVSGVVAFPIDMLRYDSCYPATEHDSGVIEAAMRHDPGIKTVRLRMAINGSRPTIERWLSFIWVVDVNSITEIAPL